MEARLSLEDTKMVLAALEHLSARVKSGKATATEIDKALYQIASLKAKLEAGEYCEAGSEEICASTRIGIFW